MHYPIITAETAQAKFWGQTLKFPDTFAESRQKMCITVALPNPGLMIIVY